MLKNFVVRGRAGASHWGQGVIDGDFGDIGVLVPSCRLVTLRLFLHR
jgi:hypothetical protein